MHTEMSPSHFTYSSYYSPHPQHISALIYPELIHLPPDQDYSGYSMPHQDQSTSHSMHPPPSPSIPIDPSLALYPPYYSNYQQPPHHLPQHLSLLPSYSSPSSQGSDTIGTPPTEHVYPSSSNSKRPSSSLSNHTMNASRKKARKDDESDHGHSPSAEKEEVKAKPTRGSRSMPLLSILNNLISHVSISACTVCRRLKMKCVGAEQGLPCKRCLSGNHECIFEESNRGKRSSK